MTHSISKRKQFMEAMSAYGLTRDQSIKAFRILHEDVDDVVQAANNLVEPAQQKPVQQAQPNIGTTGPEMAQNTILHFNQTHTLLKTPLTDAIVNKYKSVYDNPDISQDSNQVITKELLLTKTAIANILTSQFKVPAEQIDNLFEVFLRRDFLTLTTKLNTTQGEYQSLVDIEFYSMKPETISRYLG